MSVDKVNPEVGKPADRSSVSTFMGTQSPVSDYDSGASSVKRAYSGTKKMSRSDVLQLQRTIGNQAVMKLLSRMKANTGLLQRAGSNGTEAQQGSGAASSAKDLGKK